MSDLLDDLEKADAEVERLTRWQSEAMTVMDGLQELGSALGLPLGYRITGPAAVAAATTLRAERDALAARIAKVEALLDVRPSDPFCDVDDAGRVLFVLGQDLREALRGEVDG